MRVDRRTLISTGAFAAVSATTAASARVRHLLVPPRNALALWPGAPPGAGAAPPALTATIVEERGHRLLQYRGIASPALHFFPAARPDGRALLVLPGGGYGLLSMTSEGFDVADTFNPIGISVFVLAYRLPAEGWERHEDVPLQDAQRAMRLIRARAAEWRVNPDRVGVLGFSAGGHLAVTLAKSFDEPVYAPIDSADRLSARPDIAALLYPVISMTDALTHGWSRDNLLGKAPADPLIAKRSGEIGMRPDMPPLFMLHAVDDAVVKVDNTLTMLAGARSAGVRADVQILSEGGHGFGSSLLPARLPGALWPALFASSFSPEASQYYQLR